ncbi:MAG: hypothetical protein R3293_28165, partial [Candidatus Promineifilaceae bacterium]|nr:hypothetical protein [Candidatus Promineifilaceae bacterium]
MSAIDRYITPDELIWVYRSIQFREALLAREWGETLVAGHPGVITTWLGALGVSSQLIIDQTVHDSYNWILHLAWLTPDNMLAFKNLSIFLGSGRMLIATVISVGIVGVYFLSRQLIGSCLALLLALLLAIDPFYAGLGGLLHVDGLVSTFVILSLLSLALAAGYGEKIISERLRMLYAALSGGTAALAVLSKSPALLLLPTAMLVLLLMFWTSRNVPLVQRAGKIFLAGIIWAGCFLIVAILLYPALWSSPLNVISFAGGNAGRHVAEALRPTFFLGQVAFDHGAAFYPIAVAWRIGPAVTIGLTALLVLALSRENRKTLPLRTLFVFALWTVIFMGLITITTKKFDRYALPVIPALMVLAVIGLGSWLRKGNRWGGILLAAVLILQILYTLFVWPFPLSAYNLLLGGPYTAQKVMPLGWGESISSAGTWLTGEENVEKKAAVSGIA